MCNVTACNCRELPIVKKYDLKLKMTTNERYLNWSLTDGMTVKQRNSLMPLGRTALIKSWRYAFIPHRLSFRTSIWFSMAVAIPLVS